MKVIVTGGAGFVGSHLVRRLRAMGDEVAVIDLGLLPSYGRWLGSRDPSVKSFRVDVTNSEDMADVFRIVQPDLVYHLAAESHVDHSIRSPEEAFTVNAVGTHITAQLCVKHDAPMVYCSTDEVYGDSCLSLGRLNVEDDPVEPSSPYSAGKAAGEMAVRSMVRTFGLRASITRACNAYGPGQEDTKLVPLAIKLLNAGQPVSIHGTGMQIRQWIHVDDFVSGLLMAADHAVRSPHLGVFNLAGPARCSVISLVRALADAMNVSFDPVVFVADRRGQDAAYGIVGKTAEKHGFKAIRSIKTSAELHALIDAYTAVH